MEITFHSSVLKAAQGDELAKVLHRALTTFNNKQKAMETMENASDYMKANAVFIAECEANIQAIDHVLNRAANQLRGKKLCLAS